MSPCSCSYHYKLLSLMVWPAPPALCFCSYPSHWLSLAFVNQRPCGTLLAQTKDAGSSRKLGSWAAVDTAGASKPFQQCPAFFCWVYTFQEAAPISFQPHEIIGTFTRCWLEWGSGSHFVRHSKFLLLCFQRLSIPKAHACRPHPHF